jgi:Divergent InlB B-repeat domain
MSPRYCSYLMLILMLILAAAGNSQPSMTSVARAGYCTPGDCNDVMGARGPYPGGGASGGYLSPVAVNAAVQPNGILLSTGPQQAGSGAVEVWVGVSPAIRETCAEPCQVDMSNGEPVSLRPVPATGYAFAGWIDNGGICNAFEDADCDFSVTENAEVHAVFVPTGVLADALAAADSDPIFADGFNGP